MKLEVLLATMNQTDDSVLDSIGVHSDVLVCNQTDVETDYKSYIKDGYSVRWYDFQERGVGLNRNNALLRATGDICLLADDDVLYETIKECVLNPDIVRKAGISGRSFVEKHNETNVVAQRCVNFWESRL